MRAMILAMTVLISGTTAMANQPYSCKMSGKSDLQISVKTIGVNGQMDLNFTCRFYEDGSSAPDIRTRGGTDCWATNVNLIGARNPYGYIAHLSFLNDSHKALGNGSATLTLIGNDYLPHTYETRGLKTAWMREALGQQKYNVVTLPSQIVTLNCHAGAGFAVPSEWQQPLP